MSKDIAGQIPGLNTYSLRLGPAAAATPLGATVNNDRAYAHRAIKVKGVKVIAEDAVNGADTNSVTLVLYNLKGDGSGTVVIATLALTNGVNLADETPKVIPLSATAADLLVAKGDVLTFRQVKVGNGMNIAVMHMEVEYKLQ